MKEPWWKKIIPLFWFSLLALASCYKLAKLYQHYDGSFENILDIIRTIIILLIFYLIVYIYLRRASATVKAQGPKERWLPLFINFFAPVYFGWILKTRGMPPEEIYGFGLLIALYGWFLSLRSLWFLKHSFSIMAEARKLVTDGPYRTVRHPLYLGEILMVMGLWLMYWSWEAFAIFAISTGLQLYRAKIEERKLREAFPEQYENYLEQTGFIFPRFTIKRTQQVIV